MFLSEALLLLSAVARKLSNGILGSRPQDQRPCMHLSEAVELPTVVAPTYSNRIRDSKPREHRQHMFPSEALLLRTAVPGNFLMEFDARFHAQGHSYVVMKVLIMPTPVASKFSNGIFGSLSQSRSLDMSP